MVGVQLNDIKVVAKEHIVDKSRSVVTYNAGKNPVWTLLVDQDANVLLAGEPGKNNNDCVVQYRLDTGEVTRKYGSLGIEIVLSSTRLGNLCFFGGYNLSSFAVINILTQQVVLSPVKTAVAIINSLAVCIVNPNTPDAKAVLAMAGEEIDYSANRTDMFDVTQLVYWHGSPQIVAELPVLKHQRKQDILHRVHTLEQQLRKQAQAHEATVKAKDRELDQLKSENQALQDALQSLKKKRKTTQLRKQTSQNNRQALQKVILGLLGHSPIELDFGASPESSLVGPTEPGMDTPDTEDLKARLADVRKRNRTLTGLNQELQVQIVDLRARVRTLTAPCGGW